MTPVKTAVVGVGVQGQRHAEKLAALPSSQLVVVVDADEESARSSASKLGVESARDFRKLIGKVSAAVVATPTSTHFDITSALLENGIHVLLEKPITTTMEEARKLVDIADAKGVVFQVGYLERFNVAVMALTERIHQPQFVESHRIAPYNTRALDVSVVLDLMTHDIDLIHSIVQSPMENVDAVGRSVFSENIDIANARIRFVNGCVANVTSSRISLKTERALRVFQEDSYLSANLHKKTLTTYKKRGTGPVTGPEDITIDKQSFGESDALSDQANAFLESVNGGPAPLVSGRTAMEALDIATAIGELVAAQQA